MCLTPGSLGCGTCESCKAIDSEGLEGQNVVDFKEIDAAQHSGVENARLIAAPEGWGEAPPNIAKRRVTLIEEAHRLSEAAWSVFLKPLEQEIDYSTYLFSTTEGLSIPQTVRSRCVRVRFVKVSEDNIFGLLVATAARENVPYETAALKLIAKRSEGSPRNAMEYFGRVASMGKINTEFVDALIENTLENKCNQLWATLVTKNQKLVSKIVADMVSTHTPASIVEAMVLDYADAVREPSNSIHAVIREIYSNVGATTAFFLKWLAVPQLPADAVQLFAYELMYLTPKVLKLPDAALIATQAVEARKESTEELFS